MDTRELLKICEKNPSLCYRNPKLKRELTLKETKDLVPTMDRYLKAKWVIQIFIPPDMREKVYFLDRTKVSDMESMRNLAERCLNTRCSKQRTKEFLFHLFQEKPYVLINPEPITDDFESFIEYIEMQWLNIFYSFIDIDPYVRTELLLADVQPREFQFQKKKYFTLHYD
jgi:hypothetical protein